MTKPTMSKREAERILRRAGWRIVKMGSHEVWSDGAHRLSLPHTVCSGGLYGWLANQIRKIEAGEDLAKVFKRGEA